ncbi:MAG: tyrosine--tRNA ligase [candidate division Zixibacteria bacterium HGW-Zixibacteria-1]|nr:MAG: tyrosine--tRNA ligase [candidate division Zixibacteria bacterium HGW-Zixibacteria-1]
MQTEFDRQFEIISRGAVEILPGDEFKTRLKKSIDDNKPLRVKQGFDPTAPDIHLGHTVGIRKLKQFQQLGHKIVLIIGDYTGLVGDPSGRSATRPQLSYEQIMANAETYQKQFFKILDKSKTEIHFNGEWFKKMSFQEILGLASRFTVARILERDDFDKRFKANNPISIHELFYPLMQAYDSVAIKADVEIGATEQKFNLLTGREIQQDYGLEPQLILTMPVLVGVDGHNRMSKSLGNYIGIDEPPNEIFGKVMSIPDNLIYSYFELVTDVSAEELEQIRNSLRDESVNPRDIKMKLGETIVEMYHSHNDAVAARDEFIRMFRHKQLPDEVPEFDCSGLGPKIWIVKILTDAGMAASNGEARRLIKGGGVSLNNEKITDDNLEITPQDGMLIKAGKRRFIKLRVG